MSTESYGHTPKEVIALQGLIDTFLRWKNNAEKSDRKYFQYHPSEWGKCLRKQQYLHYVQLGQMSVVHPELPSLKIRLFDKGHNMHDRWSRYFDEIGDVLMGRWRCKNRMCRLIGDDGKPVKNIKEAFKKLAIEGEGRLTGKPNEPMFRPKECICGCKDFEYVETRVLSERLNMAGNADLVLNCDNLNAEKFKTVPVTFNTKYLPVSGRKVVIDMKTANSNSFQRQVLKKGAHPEYLVQLTIYIHLLGCDYGLIVYECKNDSKTQWIKVDRNPAWWETIQRQALWMIENGRERINQGKKGALPPPKPLHKKEMECSYCSFKSLCHKSEIWKMKTLERDRKLFYGDLLFHKS